MNTIKGRRACAAAALIFGFFLSSLSPVPALPAVMRLSRINTETTLPTPSEYSRCVWLDRGSIVAARNQAGMERLFDDLKQCGFSNVYFEANNAGYALFDSSVLAKNPLVDSSFDPLALAVTEAHRRGMKLHAWMWVFNVGSLRHNELIGKPADDHGPVLIPDRQSWALRSREDRAAEGEFWLSPANADACAFLKKEIVELATKYEVDGVQLDYIRFPFQKAGTEMGFDIASRSAFERDTGLTLDRPGRQVSEKWRLWKQSKVNNFVHELSAELRTVKPGICISAAVFPFTRSQRLAAIQQDWETWVENGWVDVLNPMTYEADAGAFARSAGFVVRACKGRCRVYPGVAVLRFDAQALSTHLDALRAAGAQGFTVFAAAHIDRARREALAADVSRAERILSHAGDQPAPVEQTPGTR